MKRMRFLLGILPVLAFAAFVAGCASPPGPHCPRLSANGFFCLLAPAALPETNGTDLVTVTRAGETTHYVGRLAINAERLELALANLAGVPLAMLSWDGKAATIRAPRSKHGPKLDPERLTALLELTLAAPVALRSALHGLQFSIVRGGPAGGERRLAAGGKEVAKAVTTAQGATHISVPRLGLTIVLEPLPARE